MLSGKLSLELLRKYCSFIFQNYFSEFVREDLKRNKEVDVPILRFFSHLSDEELIAMSNISISKYLNDIIEGKAIEVVFQSMKDWKADKLKGVSKNSLEAADIALIYNTRKHSLLKFLPKYTQDYKLILDLVNEIEDFYTFQLNLAIQTFADIKQEQLLENKNKLKDAQVMANLGNWEYNLVTGKAYWSDQLYTIYGLKEENYPDGINPNDVSALLKPEDLIKFRENMEHSIKSNTKYNFEFSIVKPDGTVCILADQGLGYLNDKGEGVVKGITQDITERRLAEDKLQKQDHFISHIVESTPDIIYVYSLEEKAYLYQNKKFASILGYGNEFDGDPASILNTVHPDDVEFIAERNSKYLTVQDGEIIEDELRFKDKNNEWRWINFRGMAFERDTNGFPTQIIGTARDITKEKTTQQELKNLNVELQATNENLKTLQEELQASNEELAESNIHLEERINQRTIELVKQREYLLSVLFQAPAAIAILRGPDLVFELTTPLYLSIVGKKEILGKSAKEAIPELIEQGLGEVMLDVYRTSEPYYGYEYPVMRGLNENGQAEEAYFNFVIVPLKNPDGSIDGIMVHAVEVTMQVNAAKEAKESSKKFELVLESIPPMAWTAFPDGRVNYFSQRWYDYTGLAKDDSFDSAWERAIHPDEREYAWKVWNEARESGKPLEVEHRFFEKSTKEHRWHIVRGAPLKGENGQIKLWVGTCTDIHDMKKLAKAFEDREKQLRLITNNIPAFVSYVDTSEKYVFANKYYNNLAYVKDEVEGKYIKDILGDKYQISQVNISKALSGEEVTFTNKILLKDDTFKELEVKYVPDFDKSGKVKGFVVLGVDLTERIEIENALEKKNADLIRINADLDNFIYTASHDLKSPVSNIEGLIMSLNDTFEDKNLTDHDIKELMEMINISIKRFKSTINDLTEISKTQKNIHENTEWIHVKDIFEEVKYGIENQIKESEATIFTDFNCNQINFSRINLKSIFHNLLTNSIKYKSPLRKPIVSVKCSETVDYHLIEVMDNGLGLKPEHQGKIFGMFKRFHDHVEGSGVGLYLVKRIIDNVKGTIEVESKEGEGTTFKLFLPKKV